MSDIPEAIPAGLLGAAFGGDGDLSDAGKKVYGEHDVIPMNEFPHVREKADQKTGKITITGLKQTRANLEYLLACYGIRCSYDVYKKAPVFKVPWVDAYKDGWNDAAIDIIESQCALCLLPVRSVEKAVMAVCYANPVYPVRDWLRAQVLPDDNVDYIQQLADLIVVPEEDKPARDIIVKLWLFQCCAAADLAEGTKNTDALARYEHVMVLQAGQGIEKTKFLRQIVPEALRDYFLDGITLDPSNKDSIAIATGGWITELGEIEATFTKKALTMLKSFMSMTRDIFRVPYGRVKNEWRRATSFCGTCNEVSFLKDRTGNRRFWPLRVMSLTLPESAGLDMARVWALAWAWYESGAAWWPDQAQALVIASSRERSEQTHESALMALVWERFGELSVEQKAVGCTRMTSIQILRAIGQGHSADSRACREMGEQMEMHNLDADGQPDFSRRASTRYWLMPPPLAVGEVSPQDFLS